MVGRNISVSLSAPVSHYSSSQFVGLLSRDGGMELSGPRKPARWTGTLSDPKDPPTRPLQPSPGVPSLTASGPVEGGQPDRGSVSQSFPAGEA